MLEYHNDIKKAFVNIYSHKIMNTIDSIVIIIIIYLYHKLVA